MWLIFLYLGSSFFRDGSFDSEINLMFEKLIIKDFRKLENHVWSAWGIAIKIMFIVYESCVLTDLLYSSETWTISSLF